MNYIEAPTNIHRRASINRLSIVPELVSARHEFFFEEKRVTLQLPPLDQESTPREARRIECHRWKSEGMIPLEFVVYDLDIEIEIEKPIRLPEKLLQLPPNQYDLLGSHEQQLLNGVVEEGDALIQRAFEYWFGTIRWKSGIGYIGQPQIRDDLLVAGGAALRDRVSGHRFWVQGGIVRVTGTRLVTAEHWASAQNALSIKRRPPVWFDFLFDAEMRISDRDLSAAVLSLAIALEAIVRTIYSTDLKKGRVDPVLVEILDLSNLRALLNRLRKLSYWDNAWEAAVNFSTLNALMNCRDRVMHSAETRDLNEKELKKMYDAVKKFAYFSCEYLGLD